MFNKILPDSTEIDGVAATVVLLLMMTIRVLSVSRDRIITIMPKCKQIAALCRCPLRYVSRPRPNCRLCTHEYTPVDTCVRLLWLLFSLFS